MVLSGWRPDRPPAESHAASRYFGTVDAHTGMADNGGVPGGAMADSPYQKAPGKMTAAVVLIVLLLLLMVALATANGEFSNWM